MKKLKKIPYFKSEKEENDFWQTHDSTEYVNWSKAKRVQFPNLRLTSQPITIRLPGNLINRIKIKAHTMDIPYQTYIKQLLFETMETQSQSDFHYPFPSKPDSKKFLAMDRKSNYKIKKINKQKRIEHLIPTPFSLKYISSKKAGF